ncbi:hypothetical protein B0J13DRAFT_642257 [Dactylonectria estremocensis]|uniref:Uncharacterized protein n=1 Tax=Dactylonectria estremocensis TaxID=1079267 RepID=A0A9P9E4Y6_9HYPO|nr:hypothetical protein B0J13DRAFT_642257 [Dactylonectria estremocensis]
MRQGSMSMPMLRTLSAWCSSYPWLSQGSHAAPMAVPPVHIHEDSISNSQGWMPRLLIDDSSLMCAPARLPSQDKGPFLFSPALFWFLFASSGSSSALTPLLPKCLTK